MYSTDTLRYDRLISLDEVRLYSAHLILVKATLTNSGTAHWQTSPTEENSTTCALTMRLSCHDTFFPAFERAFPIAGDLVQPGESKDIEQLLYIPQVSSGFRIEIDLVLLNNRRQLTRFSELGCSPVLFNIQANPTPLQPTLYKAQFCNIDLFPLSKEFMRLCGNVKNSGTMPWHSPGTKNNFLVGLRSYVDSGTHAPVWEGRGHLEQSNLAPGEKTLFTATIPTKTINDSRFIKLSMLKESYFWFDEQGSSAYMYDLKATQYDLHGYHLKEDIFTASILPKTCVIRDEFLIQVSGFLKHTGARVWNPANSSTAPRVSLGIRLTRSESIRVLREGRSSLPSRPIMPGESIPFSITLSCLGLPQGNYCLTLDLLSESQFWFSQCGSLPIGFSVHIPERPEIARDEPRPCNFRKLTDAPNSRLLFVSQCLPRFDKEAGGRRLLHLLEILVGLGFTIDFFHDSSDSPDESAVYIEALLKLGINVRSDLHLHLLTLAEDAYDTCILAWWECAERYQASIRSVLPRTRIIIDTVDIHWVRELRGVETGEVSLSPEALRERKLRELSVYQGADLVWVVTEEDRQALLQEDPLILHHLIPLIFADSNKPIRKLSNNGIIFVGGFRHTPNIKAAELSIEYCNAFRSQSGSQTPLYIIGDQPPIEISSRHEPGVTEVLGHVKDLESYFSRARVLIAPLLSGAGMKGKVCEAALNGVPVITTSIGVEGLNFEPDKDFFLANSENDFVQALSKAFDPHTDLIAMRDSAWHKVSKLTSISSVSKSLENSLLFRPVVIAIITWNKKELLKECLDAILTQTDYAEFIIAVVSNGCTDGTAELLSEYQKQYPGKIESWFNKENEFFVKPNNFIINHYKSHDVVMVNNDVTVVGKDWLTYLYQGAYSSPFIAAAGGLTLDGKGMVSEAGADIDLNGYGQNIGRGAPPYLDELRVPRLVSYCSGCLLYLRRDVLDEIGPFNEDFHPMYYEDVEWQYRAKKHGYETLYVPQCTAIHREGSSAGTNLQSGMKRYQEINRLKFLATGLLKKGEGSRGELASNAGN